MLLLWHSGHWGRSLELDYPWMWGGEMLLGVVIAAAMYRRAVVPRDASPA